MLGNFSSLTFDQIWKEIPAKSQCPSKTFMVLVSCDFSLFYHYGRDMGVAGVNWLLNGLDRPLSANFRSLFFFSFSDSLFFSVSAGYYLSLLFAINVDILFWSAQLSSISVSHHWILSHEWAQRTNGISSWTREDKIHIHKRVCNILYIGIYDTKRGSM